MNNDRIRNWALVAEIVSGFAVVITLVFLAFEISKNSDLIQADTFNRNIESLIDWRMQIASSDDSLQIMADHWKFENTDLLRRQLLVINMWSIYEKAYYSQRYGLLGAAEWQRFKNRFCPKSEERSAFWEKRIAMFLTEEFRDYVVRTCELRRPSRPDKGQ